MRIVASPSAARFWAFACPNGWPRSAGRTATETAKNVSSAAARSVPECAASASSPRLPLAIPATSLIAMSTQAAPTETSAMRRCGDMWGRLRRAGAYRLPRRACSRSIASKSALKFPIPKPREPWRSMTSKKSVGRSWTIFVKSWSR